MSEIETKAPEAKKKKSIKRRYAGEGELDHDLFKLLPADTLKNLGVDDPKNSEPEYTKVLHIHFFHTIDSDGRTQDKCVAIGGHTHMMQVTPDPEGGVPKVTCGPAVKEVRKKLKGKFVRTLEEIPYDDHTHEVVYMDSQKIKKRSANVEATTVLTVDANRVAPMPGIQG